MNIDSLNKLSAIDLQARYMQTFMPEYGPVPGVVFELTTQQERVDRMKQALETGQPVKEWHRTTPLPTSDPMFEAALKNWQAYQARRDAQSTKDASDTTGSKTARDYAIQYGVSVPEPDDPIFKSGWIIGATVPYRHRPDGQRNTPSETKSESNQEKPVEDK